jgi:hypothetical protein
LAEKRSSEADRPDVTAELGFSSVTPLGGSGGF